MNWTLFVGYETVPFKGEVQDLPSEYTLEEGGLKRTWFLGKVYEKRASAYYYPTKALALENASAVPKP